MTYSCNMEGRDEKAVTDVHVKAQVFYSSYFVLALTRWPGQSSLKASSSQSSQLTDILSVYTDFCVSSKRQLLYDLLFYEHFINSVI